MTAFLSFSGQRAHTGSITIPFSGLWSADLHFAETAELSNTSTLTCGDLSLLGTIYRQSVFAGQRMARIVGGYGGWLKQLPARAYTLPGAVRLSLVLGDAAAAVGEKITISSDHIIGDYFIREAAEAQRVLRQLAGTGWYVDTVGTTHVGTRTAAQITKDYLVNTFDGARGELMISTESYAEWLPGNTFTNALVPAIQTISTVRIDVDNQGTLRHTILTHGPETDSDRMAVAIRQIIRAEFPRLSFLGLYSYTVLESSSDDVTCRAADAGLGLPSLVKIPTRAGVAGMRCRPREGTSLAVAFLDGNPARPVIAGIYDMPTLSAPVVCYSDIITIGSTGVTGAITGTASATRRVQVEIP